ncbi:hypothetical protein [Dethiothermospora halolimnae]|uniref:hypothetical protein n=1 Tax=Dethiothermospora halolimnae TaxID=3114390 RepID=UPI003CCB9FDB
MKKVLVIVTCMALSLNLFGCSSNEVNTTKKDIENNKKEITIAVRKSNIYPPGLEMYRFPFGFENDVKVNLEEIKASTHEEYLKKLNTKLYLEDGPTLILIDEEETYDKYVNQGVALEVGDKIPNIDKLYDGFKKEKMYYVPIVMDYTPIEIHREALEQLEIKEPKLDWTKEDYIKIKEKWFKKQPRIFSLREYLDTVKYPFKNIKIFNNDMTDVKINTDEIKNYVKDAKNKIFSGRYALKKEHKYYKYAEYDNWKDEGVMELVKFNDSNKIGELDDRLLISNWGDSGLKFRESFGRTQENIVKLPEVMRNEYQIRTWGLIVNRNGKNTDLGFKFINGLLEDEHQINIYKNQVMDDFPVNKDIEGDIDKLAKEKGIKDKFINLRKYILNKFNKGEYKLYKSQGSKKIEFYDMLEKDLAKIIFDKREYTDKELNDKLQKLENKYNMWITE